MRLQGYGLREIGEAQVPPVSRQAIYKTIERALARIVLGPHDEIRQLEFLRLDEMLVGVYERAISGDVAAIDRVLAMSLRRARLVGLDMVPGPDLRFPVADAGTGMSAAKFPADIPSL